MRKEVNPILFGSYFKHYRKVLLIFFFSFIVRLVFLFQFKTDPFFNLLTLDSEYYSNWAIEIAKGSCLGNEVYFTSPLYAYFLAVLYRFFNYDIYWVLMTQFFLGSIHCVLIYLIGKRFFGEVVGLIGSLIAALFGFFIFLEGQILKNSLAYLLSTSAFLIYLISREKQKNILLILVGVLTGLTSLVIPNFIVFAPLLCITLFIEKARPLNKMYGIVAVIAGLIFTIGPVALRNYYVGDDLVLISYNGGVNFFLGTDKETDGGLKRSKLIQQVPLKEESSSKYIAEKTFGKILKPSEISHFWYVKAHNIIREDPVAYLNLILRKIYRFWNWRELTDNLDYYYFSEKYIVLNLPLFSFGMIIPLAFLGMWLSRNEIKRLLPAYIFVLSFTFSSIPFPIFGRYRAPILPILMIFAAYGITTTLHKITKKELNDLAIGVSIFLISFVIINSGDEKHNFSYMHQILGQIYLKQGKTDNAVAELKIAIRMDTQNAEARNALGKAYYKRNMPHVAIKELETAIQIASNFVDAHYTLGLIFYELGEDKKAIEEFRKVMELDTTGEKSRILGGLIN